ncbi:MAG: response regulator [Proteobacteria bacterium]|nr:response regulator [Pseudomonadota bacterium]
MKILVVDDSKTSRKLIRRYLKQAGFGDHPVEEAENGKHALDVIKESSPDIILSDWNMPILNGIGLLKTINKEGIEVVFGFVTSEGSEEMRKLAADNGAKFYIAKPYKTETFKEQLDNILQA